MRATEPFSFVDYEGLVMPIGRRATNIREFLDLLGTVSLDVIQHHLHRAPLQRRFDESDYPNDFATWAAKGLEDLALAEKLAALDPYGYGRLEEAREAISSLVEDHLSELSNIAPVRPGFEFHFASGHYLALSSGREAWSLAEMRQAIAEVPLSSIFFHFHEARLRGPGEDIDDFSRWIDGQFGPHHPVADEIRKLDFYFFSLDELRQRLVAIFDEHALRVAR